ncbi:hypothetical protein [Enterobacter cloacae]|uniref:hypothetical protein n=1 Tax=Enterobacter cloacae TaxID=550 RepID=UPI003463FD32
MSQDAQDLLAWIQKMQLTSGQQIPLQAFIAWCANNFMNPQGFIPALDELCVAGYLIKITVNNADWYQIA